ncbi:MAG: DUF2062 domain-containing protein [Rhizobiaceae bacterium]
MILGSNQEKAWTRSLSRLVWPRKSYVRSLRYHGKRILRIRASPHALASGFAAGIFAAFSPALGFHVMLALLLAWGFGGNLIAAALGTAAANPLTFPLMVAGEFKIGTALFGIDNQLHVPLHVIGAKLMHLDFASMWQPVLKPLLAGSVLLGGLFAVLAYYLVFRASATLAHRRRERELARRIVLP